MISATIKYLKKHKRGILITLGVSGGIYFLGKYAKWKIIEFQEKAEQERRAKDNIRRRFQQRQIDCAFTVASHLPSIAEILLKRFDVESILDNLQKAKNSTPNNSPGASIVLVNDPNTTPSSSVIFVDKPVDIDNGKIIETNTEINDENNVERSENRRSDSSGSSIDSDSQSPVSGSHSTYVSANHSPTDKKIKLELLNEVKYKSFIRSIAAIYLETFLTLIITIQLNLLGRYNYLYSITSLTERDREQVIQINPPTGSILNPDIEKKYLTFIWWFLNVGYEEVVERIRIAVETQLSTVSLKQELSYKDFVWLLSEIRSRIERTEDDRPYEFLNVLIPEDQADELRVLDQGGGGELDHNVDPKLRRLLDETKDFLHGQDFTAVLSSCVSSAFSLMQQDLHTHFVSDEPTEKKVTLSKLLPAMKQEAHIILSSVHNKFLDAIKECKELQALCAVIYSSFDDI
ncbi:16043_t:CDS:2 [Dentiscutata heterogama]|uniref:16043_t:CDS:1 n=1 Tax=Dentiscutata heterogama TaxID=1316150 RepID=A0ACA9MIQ8_9GLOM|nr:16043_t:CDS:2 [Dentiscutata heterogama]